MTSSQVAAERAAELTALHEAVRDLAAGAGGAAAARRQLDAGSGIDASAWRLLGRDMGLAGLGIAEELGGVGGGLAELTVVAQELGRTLLPVPFLSSTVVVGQILARCHDRAAAVLAELCSGTKLGAFAGLDAEGCWRPDRLTVTADATGESWLLSGTSDFVLDGAAADHFVVAAQTPAGCDLFLVAADADGVQRRALDTLDASRGQASVQFAAAVGTPLTDDGAGPGAVGPAVDRALVVLAAEQVGGAKACLDMAVEYAKIRHQFSRPIGSFQAVKHKLADLLLLVEMGRSAIDRALLAEDDPARLAEAAALAKVWCSDAYTEAATENVHIHGGMGFTWEHDAHLYFRRARTDEMLFGDASVHRERLATLLGW